MQLTALTDLHGRLDILPRFESVLRQADLILLVGDNTHFGHYDAMQSVIQGILPYNEKILAVSGNCDYPDGEQFLVERGISINNCLKEFRGLHFAGMSGSLPCPGTTPHEYHEEEYQVTIDTLVPDIKNPWILVTHQPPFHTKNDRIAFGIHVGSKVIRRFIEDFSPLVCFTGHIHEGTGIDTLNRTKLINPGPARDGHYASLIMEDGIIKDLRMDRV
jgi:Icc-related predicted phosphoesterase